ncbi:hypothetical protein EXN22_11300 [Pseudomonas tructae]|uniref:Lipoprotein n=1 Tax=Pseudomonas tructae TaxID=2518644 RepID=A0A411MHW7_9PSED|nr:hypothetical protein [Pseudomonas tructae]QBF26249.1 hypothetical protein EXN22_11300 [Pseudomonas tructae]
MLQRSVVCVLLAIALSGCQPKWKEKTEEEVRQDREFAEALWAKDRARHPSYEEWLNDQISPSRSAEQNVVRLLSRSLDRCLDRYAEPSPVGCSKRSVPIVDSYYFDHYYTSSKKPPAGYLTVSHAYLKWSSAMEAIALSASWEVVSERVLLAREAIERASFPGL